MSLNFLIYISLVEIFFEVSSWDYKACHFQNSQLSINLFTTINYRNISSSIFVLFFFVCESLNVSSILNCDFQVPQRGRSINLFIIINIELSLQVFLLFFFVCESLRVSSIVKCDFQGPQRGFSKKVFFQSIWTIKWCLGLKMVNCTCTVIYNTTMNSEKCSGIRCTQTSCKSSSNSKLYRI